MREKLGPKLADWLRRAIEVRPEKRFKNAATMYREFKRLRNGAGKKHRRVRASKADDPSLWQKVLFRQFQRKYGKSIEARYRCRHCAGPVSELMQCCPWCGTEPPLDRHREPPSRRVPALPPRREDRLALLPVVLRPGLRGRDDAALLGQALQRQLPK